MPFLIILVLILTFGWSCHYRVVEDNRLDPRQSKTIGPMRIEEGTIGLEHLVAVAAKVVGQPIDFTWLAQESLEQAPGTRSAAGGGNDTPVGTLLEQALFATGNTRGVSRNDMNAVTFRVVSWQTRR